MKLLITRPISAARDMKTALQSEGHEVILSPLLEISFRPLDAIDLTGIQGIIVSSMNGVQALSRLTEVRDLPVYAVGEKSATAAKGTGFKKIFSADGDVHDLAKLIINKADPQKGPLLHAGGARLAGDLKGELESAGFSYRREVLYDAHDASDLSPKALTALKQGDMDGILLFSPHTAKVLKLIIDGAKLDQYITNIDFWCLSQNVADALKGLNIKSLHVAARPTEASLLDLIKQKAAQSGQGEQKVAVPPSGKKDDDKKPEATQSAKAAPKAGQQKTSSDKTATSAKAGASVKSPSKGPAPSSSASKEPKAEPVKQSGNGKMVAYGVAGAFLLGLVAWPVLLPVVAPVLPESAMTLLKGYWPEDQKVSELEARLAVLEKNGAGAGPQTADTSAFTEALERLRAELQQNAQQNQAALDGLKSALQTLEETQTALEQQVSDLQNVQPVIPPVAISDGDTEGNASAAAAASELTALRSALASVNAEIARVKQAQSAAEADLSAQKTDVETLSAAVNAAAQSKEAADANGNESLILLALGQIHRESRSDAPFTGALQQGLAVTPASLQSELAGLADIAKTGAPTLRQLMDGFEAEAANIVQAARLPASDTWYGKTLHNLASLVKFRRIDDIEGNDVDAIVARAEKALIAGDLAAAITALKTLEGAPAEAAASWVQKAEARLKVDQTLDNILSKVTASAALDAEAAK